jgi:DNA-directed RNA polymerase specialized sigma24 family protein
MANLTDEQAKLLRLWTEEDSAVAAAQRLGMSPDSVRSRLYRIRAKLRNRLNIHVEVEE